MRQGLRPTRARLLQKGPTHVTMRTKLPTGASPHSQRTHLPMKSHVSLAHYRCPVCGTQHSETILLDRRLRDALDPTSFLGWSLCPEHQQQADDGFVFLVELREEPSSNNPRTLQSTWPLRTGTYIALRRSAAQQIFSVEPQQLNFCTPDLTALLQSGPGEEDGPWADGWDTRRGAAQ